MTDTKGPDRWFIEADFLDSDGITRVLSGPASGWWEDDVETVESQIAYCTKEGIPIKVTPYYTVTETFMEAHRDLVDLAQSVENDAEQVPEWLWDRLQAALSALAATEPTP